jgi:3-methyladenine DNA glycosylase/8-oxoguanine DNA glycosylase
MPDRMTHARASAELAGRDEILARLVARHRPPRLGRPTPVAGRFEALSQAIVHQQLAGRAAASIWARVRALVDGPFLPESVAALGAQHLRGAGLSAAKAASVQDLAAQVGAGTVRLARIGRRSDDDVVAELTRVRGIGPWTAHMFLLFDLQRLDVWPTGDYGVRNGYRLAWGLDDLPTPRQLEALGAPFRPYRSIVAWYCWRVVDAAGSEAR